MGVSFSSSGKSLTVCAACRRARLGGLYQLQTVELALNHSDFPHNLRVLVGRCRLMERNVSVTDMWNWYKRRGALMIAFQQNLRCE